MIERQILGYQRPPRQAAFDAGFASRVNLEGIKAQWVTDVMFRKKRGLEVLDRVKSSWVYQSLQKFCAWMEGGISFLNRCFRLDRCTWSGFTSFEAYLLANFNHTPGPGPATAGCILGRKLVRRDIRKLGPPLILRLLGHELLHQIPAHLS